MDNIEILENNNLIAEFMGGRYVERKDILGNPSYQYHDLIRKGDYFYPNEIKYHESWDWIMPVIDKIESMDFSESMYSWEDIDGDIRHNFEGITVEIENKECWIYIRLALDPYWTINKETSNITYNTKIEAVYNAVIEFIKWYNKRIKEDESNSVTGLN